VSDQKSPLELLEEREAARAAKRQAREEKRAAQRLADLDAVEAFEDANPDVACAIINVDAGLDLPTLVLVRCPEKKYHTRYLARLKPKKNGQEPDGFAAHEELASVCVVYPERETYAKLCDALGGLHLQVGVAAAKLAEGKKAEEGKD
jgi:hypothetical protein